MSNWGKYQAQVWMNQLTKVGYLIHCRNSSYAIQKNTPDTIIICSKPASQTNTIMNWRITFIKHLERKAPLISSKWGLGKIKMFKVNSFYGCLLNWVWAKMGQHLDENYDGHCFLLLLFLLPALIIIS